MYQKCIKYQWTRRAKEKSSTADGTRRLEASDRAELTPSGLAGCCPWNHRGSAPTEPLNRPECPEDAACGVSQESLLQNDWNNKARALPHGRRSQKTPHGTEQPRPGLTGPPGGRCWHPHPRSHHPDARRLTRVPWVCFKEREALDAPDTQGCSALH